eukprot:CAMPEP_0178980580 /NCGR_PEP_ID=MMETSP0789-20121207/26576_1 /TAXON_ID=3005 /ORGANISM="Rhizosolenia setigera, Strain CCMP 1694" /LENGTH=256 /DNA_ID=CAMNT_0020671011 /DNA_START=775 /DNA_END=1545 /DNA_ORIENTATION=+
MTSTTSNNEAVLVAGSANNEESVAKSNNNVTIPKHPILMHKISLLRSSSTNPASFRQVLREITYHLGYEATLNDLNVKTKKLTVPVGNDHITCEGKVLTDKIALVPILRSGLGMVDSMLELLPNAGIHHIGMYKQNQMPVQYYNRLPRKCDSDVAYILDPCLATSQTMCVVVAILKKWGVEKIHVISVVASKSGLEKLVETHPDIKVTVGQVDKDLNENGVIIPGLGDAGDRLFGTHIDEEDEEDLMHQSKRKRSF